MIGAERNRQGSGGGVRKGGNFGGRMGVIGEVRGCGATMAPSNEGGRGHVCKRQVAHMRSELQKESWCVQRITEFRFGAKCQTCVYNRSYPLLFISM